LTLDEGLQLGDELGVTTEREVGIDALLEDGRTLILEARDVRLGEGLVEEVRKRRAAPES
jgi:hypothetical protein